MVQPQVMSAVALPDAAADCLTPTEQATTHAIERDFAALFARWEARGFPRTVVIPMALFFTVDVAKRSGVTYERAADTFHVIWHGRDRQEAAASPPPAASAR